MLTTMKSRRSLFPPDPPLLMPALNASLVPSVVSGGDILRPLSFRSQRTRMTSHCPSLLPCRPGPMIVRESASTVSGVEVTKPSESRIPIVSNVGEIPASPPPLHRRLAARLSLGPANKRHNNSPYSFSSVDTCDATQFSKVNVTVSSSAFNGWRTRRRTTLHQANSKVSRLEKENLDRKHLLAIGPMDQDNPMTTNRENKTTPTLITPVDQWSLAEIGTGFGYRKRRLSTSLQRWFGGRKSLTLIPPPSSSDTCCEIEDDAFGSRSGVVARKRSRYSLRPVMDRRDSTSQTLKSHKYPPSSPRSPTSQRVSSSHATLPPKGGDIKSSTRVASPLPSHLRQNGCHQASPPLSTKTSLSLRRRQAVSSASSETTATDAQRNCQQCSQLVDRLHLVGQTLFNLKPVKGVAFLTSLSHTLPDSATIDGQDPPTVTLVPPDSISLAEYLLKNAGKKLCRKMIGEYFGTIKDFTAVETLKEFMRLFNLTNLRLDEAFNKIAQNFIPDGEAQKIEKLVELFSQEYARQNPNLIGTTFHDIDSIHVLTYAVVMLNTEVTKINVDGKRNFKRMTQQDFISNLRGVNGGQNYPTDLLTSIYQGVQSSPMIPLSNKPRETLKAINDHLHGPEKPDKLLSHHRHFHGWVLGHKTHSAAYDKTQKSTIPDHHHYDHHDDSDTDDDAEKTFKKQNDRIVFIFNDVIILAKKTKLLSGSSNLIFSMRKNSGPRIDLNSPTKFEPTNTSNISRIQSDPMLSRPQSYIGPSDNSNNELAFPLSDCSSTPSMEHALPLCCHLTATATDCRVKSDTSVVVDSERLASKDVEHSSDNIFDPDDPDHYRHQRRSTTKQRESCNERLFYGDKLPAKMSSYNTVNVIPTIAVTLTQFSNKSNPYGIEIGIKNLGIVAKLSFANKKTRKILEDWIADAKRLTQQVNAIIHGGDIGKISSTEGGGGRGIIRSSSSVSVFDKDCTRF